MDDELRGWKAIADYLGTSDRTAQRWERDLGLPVRRGGGARGTTVVATPRDLDDWRSSPVGLRAESEPAPGGAEVGADVVATDAPEEPERSSRRRWLVAGVVVVLVLVAAVVGMVVTMSIPAGLANPETAATPASSSLVAGSVVVLKLTAATGESWSLRIKNGAMATWDAGGTALNLVAAADGDRVNVTLSEGERSSPGAERRNASGGLALTRGKAFPFEVAGAQMSLQWTGMEGPPLGAGATVAPPRCCVVCGGVTVCATEVVAWCGSCCDPRFTSCRPPQ
jgi:hypothetical protein